MATFMFLACSTRRSPRRRCGSWPVFPREGMGLVCVVGTYCSDVKSGSRVPACGAEQRCVGKSREAVKGGPQARRRHGSQGLALGRGRQGAVPRLPEGVLGAPPAPKGCRQPLFCPGDVSLLSVAS